MGFVYVAELLLVELVSEELLLPDVLF